ncbi:MAG: amidohydrolase [Deltaproteobacteria bacterium]|nr:amidohydrolase [Deltaproteobacteria bacterium]
MLDDYPEMYLDTTMINTVTDLFPNTWTGDAEKLARHADRVMFGSDWPNVPYAYADALASVPRFPLPPDAHRNCCGTTRCVS